MRFRGEVTNEPARAVTMSYFGSCAAAILTEGTQTVVIGGSVYVIAGLNLAKAEVLTPDGTCLTSISTAHGTGVSMLP